MIALLKFPWVRSSPAPRWTLAFWIGFAVVNLSYMFVFYDPAMSGDYYEVRAWLSEWQFGAGNPYQHAGFQVDYPPHAFLVVWPLQFLPWPVWAAINIYLCFAAGWLLMRWLAELASVRVTPIEIAANLAMLLASRSVRVSVLRGQTFPLALCLLVLALREAHRRRWLSSVCFALGSFKLNMAAGFGLALAALGAWSVLPLAAGLVLAMTVAFAASVGESPFDVWIDYARSGLLGVYGEDFRGATGLRSLLADHLPDYRLVLALWGSVALISLMMLVILSVRKSRKAAPDPRRRAILAVSSLLWALVCLPTQRYNTILVLPALWLMHWPEFRLIGRAWVRWTVSTIGLLYVVGAIPRRVEHWLSDVWLSLPNVFGVPPVTIVTWIRIQGIRLLAFGLLCVLLVEIGRRARRQRT